MSIEKARAYLKLFGRDSDIIETEASSATVELAAAALGVESARIAKTLSFMTKDGVILIVTAGDRKIDNHKYKEIFGCKAKMLSAEETLQYTGHAVGGVCPFGVPENVRVYTDVSLQRFQTVFPACGSGNSAIELTCDDLFRLSNSQAWIDICKAQQY